MLSAGFLAAGPVSRILSAALSAYDAGAPGLALFETWESTMRGCPTLPFFADVWDFIPVRTVRTKSGRTVIPLGRTLLCGSSDLPGSCDAPSRHVSAVLSIHAYPTWLPRCVIPSEARRSRGTCFFPFGWLGRAWWNERTAESSPIWSCSVWGLPCHRHY